MEAVGGELGSNFATPRFSDLIVILLGLAAAGEAKLVIQEILRVRSMESGTCGRLLRLWPDGWFSLQYGGRVGNDRQGRAGKYLGAWAGSHDDPVRLRTIPFVARKATADVSSLLVCSGPST